MIRVMIRLPRAAAGALLCLGLLAAFTGCATKPEQKFARFLERGKENLGKHDYRRAVLEFRNALQVRPKSAETYYQLGLAYLGLGDGRSAVKAFGTALQLDPKHTAAGLKMAQLAALSNYKEGVEAAEKRLLERLSEAPADADTLNSLAIAEWRLGKRDEAEQRFNDAVKQFPQDLTSAINLSRLKLSQKNPAGAEAILKKAVAASPKSADAATLLGNFYVMAGKPEQAEQQFRRALELDAKHGVALVSLAGVRLRAGHADEAEALYKRAAALPEPRYRPVHAVYLMESGKKDAAIAEFEKLAHDDPSDRTARSRLVAAYLAANQRAKAQEVLTNALRKNSHDVDALLERSQLYLRSGKYGEAQQDITAVLHFRPDSAVAHYLNAKVFQARRETQNQKQELTEALRLSPEMVAVRVELAQVHISLKSPQAALDVLNEAPAAQKNAIPIVLNRNWAWLALNRKAEARKGIDQALAMRRSPDALLQDAVYRFGQNDQAGGRASLEEALKQNPENLAALNLLFQSYSVQKQGAEGLRRVREQITRKPGSAPLQAFLGEALMKSGDNAGARQAFEAAKAADRNFKGADLPLIQIDVNEGKLDAARTRLAALIAATPGDAAPRLLLGTVEERSGNTAAAVEQYRKVVELDDRNVMALNNLGYLLAEESKQPDEGLKYAQKAQELAPDNAAVQDTMGWVLYQKGLYSSAVRYLDQSVAKEPTALRKAHLGLAYLKSGERQKGWQMVQTALKADPKLASGVLRGVDNSGR
jgi:tetratricopeptide (TPR) repeat protein